MIYLNFYFKNFILLFLFLSSILVFSFSDPIIIWFLIEINNFLFISLISLSIKNKKRIFLYFLIQIFASTIFIFSFTFNYLFINNFFIFTSIISLFIKLGIPPFHYWIPLLSIYLNWDLLIIFLSLQKIIPFYIISFLINFNNNLFINIFIIISIIFCIIIPPIKIINIYNFKKLFIYSSINQSRWIILLIYFSNIIWLIYFLFYSLFLFILISLLNLFKIFFNFHLKLSKNFNLIILFTIINFARLPPFSFFFIKWFRIFLFIFNSNFYLLLIIILFRSFIIIYIYINIIFTQIFFQLNKIKLISFIKINFNIYYSLFIFLNFFSIIFFVT